MAFFGNRFLTLEKAIELGEYDPQVLGRFEEFRRLSRYSQWQLIRQAIKNREKQLRMHWAELTNQLDLSQKPYIKEALKKIELKIEELNEDEERLLIEYAG